jgi:hypothetical protein
MILEENNLQEHLETDGKPYLYTDLVTGSNHSSIGGKRKKAFKIYICTRTDSQTRGTGEIFVKVNFCNA